MDSALVATNFSRWEQALLTRDAAKVADLYAENSTLLPTLAQRVITNRAGVLEYFTFFLSFLPRLSMVEEQVRTIAHDHYLHCGVYRFTLTTNGRENDVDARFSMVWKNVGSEWKLFHHHSSQAPAR